MRSQAFLAAVMATWAAVPTSAQTYTNCNPLTSSESLASDRVGPVADIL